MMIRTGSRQKTSAKGTGIFHKSESQGSFFFCFSGFSMYISEKVHNFQRGMRNGLPIAAGYFAVSFSLGIVMRNAGLTPLDGLIMSLLNNTSAGEAAAVGIIAANGSYLEMAASQLVINIRYFLMSAALTVCLDPDLSLTKRMIIGFDVTDEIFALLVNQKRPLSEYFAYGIAVITIPCWAAGTTLGIIFGDILPSSIVNALSIALYAMFIAVILPPCKKNSRLLLLVLVSMALSFIFSLESIAAFISEGMKIIILTLLLSSIAALVWPVREEEGK